MPQRKIATRVLTGFDDPTFPRSQWRDLLARGGSDHVFLTWEWQEAWWGTFGRGKLLLVLAERHGEACALAPLYVDAGMVFFVGSGGSDYLDFVGALGHPGLLGEVLRTAREAAPEFVGFRFYHVLDDSLTHVRLREAAATLGLACVEEGEEVAPELLITENPEVALRAASKQSLLRHERGFTREAPLEITHNRHPADIFPYLDEFFSQHIARRAVTPYPSQFLDPAQQIFYRRLVQNIDDAGWLRFTRLGWQGRAIAYHFGFCYRSIYTWYKPTFDIALARQSPGEVLLRQLILAALQEGAEAFDFGLGDEPFKSRFANRVRRMRTWGLYPQAPPRAG